MMPYYEKEQIAGACEIDLLTYLQRYEPYELPTRPCINILFPVAWRLSRSAVDQLSYLFLVAPAQ